MKMQKRIYELIHSFHPNETLSDQIWVLLYELADLAKCCNRMILEPENKRLYRAEATKAVMDMITQLQLACEYLGVDFDKMRELGWEALKDKSKKWIKASRVIKKDSEEVRKRFA